LRVTKFLLKNFTTTTTTTKAWLFIRWKHN